MEAERVIISKKEQLETLTSNKQMDLNGYQARWVTPGKGNRGWGWGTEVQKQSHNINARNNHERYSWCVSYGVIRP